MTAPEIIDKVLEHTGLNSKSLSEQIGLKRPQAIYDIQKGRTKNISNNIANKILSVFPEFNKSWLLAGMGDMLKSAEDKTLQIAANDAVYVPLLPIAAQGGSLNDFVVSVKGSDYEQVVSPIKGADFAITVSGDSMAPEYPNGCQILIKKINEKAFIDWGRTYVIDTCNGVVVKLLVPAEKDSHIKCLSINPDPKYAPFEIAFDDIYGVYRVMMCMAVK